MGDLRVCRVPFPRFANLRTAATLTVWRRSAWCFNRKGPHACSSDVYPGSSHPFSAAAPRRLRNLTASTRSATWLAPPPNPGRCPMTDQERLSTIQSYAWTLELLGEALVQHDEVLECEHNPQLSFRNTAGIHQAIRIISRLASEQCGKMIDPNELSHLVD